MCYLLTGRLGKPKITQSFMTSVNSTCNVTLTCSVDKEEKNVTYSWSSRGEEGNVLQIFWTPDNQEETYTCTAQNPVSNNSDSISAQQLCAGNQASLSISPGVSKFTLTCCKAWIWAQFSRGRCLHYAMAGPKVLLLPVSPRKESKDFWEMPGISGYSEAVPTQLPDSVSDLEI